MSQIMTYSEKPQAFLPASWPAQLTPLTNNETFLRGLPNFRSIVPSAQLPPLTSVPRNRTAQGRDELDSLMDLPSMVILICRESVTDVKLRTNGVKRRLFRYELTEMDTEMFSDTLQTFHKIMTNASIPYFMFEGTLLGSYRHHNLVPWDDDIDLILHEKHKQKTKELLQDAKSQYRLDTSTARYKFYHTSGHVIRSHPWRSPFLDISFYKEDPTHLWDIVFTQRLRYQKSDVFPLADRPFLGYMYPGPRNPLRILQVNYNVDMCGTGTYNHTAEQRKDKDKVKTVPCSSLLDVIPFVQHVRGPGGAWCEEVLTFRGHIVNIFIRNSSNIPVC